MLMVAGDVHLDDESLHADCRRTMLAKEGRPDLFGLAVLPVRPFHGVGGLGRGLRRRFAVALRQRNSGAALKSAAPLWIIGFGRGFPSCPRLRSYFTSAGFFLS